MPMPAVEPSDTDISSIEVCLVTLDLGIASASCSATILAQSAFKLAMIVAGSGRDDPAPLDSDTRCLCRLRHPVQSCLDRLTCVFSSSVHWNLFLTRKHGSLFSVMSWPHAWLRSKILHISDKLDCNLERFRLVSSIVRNCKKERSCTRS